MMHSDNKGLVLPPRIVKNKLVIIPIIFDKTKKETLKVAKEIQKQFSSLNSILDDREEYSHGWKYSEWELKGIPLRIEIGPKDLEKKSVMVVKRNTGEKKQIKISELKKEIPKILDQIQE